MLGAEMQRRAGKAVQNVKEGLSQGLGSSIDDWMYEFGERKSPELQPALIGEAGAWKYGGGVSGQQVNV